MGRGAPELAIGYTRPLASVDQQTMVPGLPASSTGYVVCALGTYAFSSVVTPATGWAGRCYLDAAWNDRSEENAGAWGGRGS